MGRNIGGMKNKKSVEILQFSHLNKKQFFKNVNSILLLKYFKMKKLYYL